LANGIEDVIDEIPDNKFITVSGGKPRSQDELVLAVEALSL
jgi:hypothetical protein